MNYVNLQFGGNVAVTWGTVDEAIALYQQIATQYGLVKPRGAFVLEFNQAGELSHLTFHYEKRGLAETDLQTFNDIWATVAGQYSISRNPTTVQYYVAAG
jgi:hypothetical protein